MISVVSVRSPCLGGECLLRSISPPRHGEVTELHREIRNVLLRSYSKTLVFFVALPQNFPGVRVATRAILRGT
jgi:hypothetical protein